MMKRWMGVLSAAMVLMALVLAGCGGGGGGDSDSPDGGSTTTYKVSGAVTANGAGLAGVTVSSGNASATTDASGNFTLNSIANGSCTVTPTLAGYTFTPATMTMTVNGANLTGKDFIAMASSAATYTVSGTITSSGAGLAGVTVSTQGGSATTNASGQYTISGLANGAYTLTPVKTGYIFTPATVAVTVNSANVAGKNFTAATSGGGGGEPWTSYFPTTVGSTWTYKAQDYSNLTTHRITSNTNNLVLMEVTDSDAYDGKIIDTYSVGSNVKLISESQYRLSTGVHIVSFTSSPGEVVIPSSTQVGTMETSTYTTSNTQVTTPDEIHTRTLTVAAVESVTVPAGTFANALKINYVDSDGTSTHYGTGWFAPGVGPVREISTNADRTIVTSENNLQSYNIVH